MRFKPDLWNSQICLSTLKFTAPFTCTASPFLQTTWNHSKETTKSGYAAYFAIENSGGNASAPWSRGMSSQSTMSSKTTASLNALNCSIAKVIWTGLAGSCTAIYCGSGVLTRWERFVLESFGVCQSAFLGRTKVLAAGSLNETVSF